jgi:chromosome segregation ATPase
MTIDERLEKLAERSDAIAQSVELLTNLHLDSERRYAELIARNEERFAKTEERMVKLMSSMDHLVDTVDRLVHTVDRLANVVTRHEERLDDMEDRPH